MQHVSDKAMLTKLKISRWSASKHDRDVSEQVARDNGSDVEMGRFTKRLLAKEALEEIRIIATKARHHHYDHTLPWTDEGSRILPAAMYFDYQAAQQEFKHQFEEAVARFVTAYPSYLADARKRLGRLYKEAEYPAAHTIGDLFTIESKISGLPNADDFRVDIGEEEREKVRADIEADLHQAVEGAMIDVWQRIHDHVQSLGDKLRAYKVEPDGKKQNVFRDSLVENMRELVGLLPRLNITGSNQLAVMTARLEDELCAVDAETLRNDSKVRTKVAKKADAILAEVADFMS